jgi:FtsP/CotA-like multicopper oxidase with cupredoxin domain
MVVTLPPQDARGRSEFRVNGKPFWDVAPYTAKLGETQLWVLRNETKWDHSLHLHGYFFMPVDDARAPLEPMQWKDTINVPMESSVRFLVTFDERPGEWMFHCHILDHADGGFMGTVPCGSAAADDARTPRPVARPFRPQDASDILAAFAGEQGC